MFSFWNLFKACISEVSVTIRWLRSLRNLAIKRQKFYVKEVQKQDPLWVSICWEAQKLSHYPVLTWYNVLGISHCRRQQPSSKACDVELVKHGGLNSQLYGCKLEINRNKVAISVKHQHGSPETRRAAKKTSISLGNSCQDCPCRHRVVKCEEEKLSETQFS